MSARELPITFTDTSYALFDLRENAVCTTRFGNLAIFSVRAVAEQWAAKAGPNVTVVEVRIKRADDHEYH